MTKWPGMVLALVFFVSTMGCANPTSTNTSQANPVPATPTGLTVTSSALSSGGDTIIITWNAVSDATSYHLYDTKDGSVPTATNNFRKYTVTNPTETLTSVSTGTLYRFAVSAVNANGESALSSVVNTTTP